MTLEEQISLGKELGIGVYNHVVDASGGEPYLNQEDKFFAVDWCYVCLPEYLGDDAATGREIKFIYNVAFDTLWELFPVFENGINTLPVPEEDEE